MKTMAKINENLTVKQDEQDPISAEVLASSIKKLGEAVNSLGRAGLSDRAIVALIQDATKLTKREIELVLWGMRNMSKFYLKGKS